MVTQKGDLLMAVSEANAARWELVKVMRTFKYWLLVSGTPRQIRSFQF
jgi:hypothetical protein